MPDITLPGNYIVSKDHGAGLMFSSMVWNAKAEEITIVYEMHDGSNWLGPKVTIVIKKDGSTLTKLDKSLKQFPNVNFNKAAVQALLDLAPINTFLENRGGDLRTEP